MNAARDEKPKRDQVIDTCVDCAFFLSLAPTRARAEIYRAREKPELAILTELCAAARVGPQTLVVRQDTGSSNAERTDTTGAMAK